LRCEDRDVVKLCQQEFFKVSGEKGVHTSREPSSDQKGLPVVYHNTHIITCLSPPTTHTSPHVVNTCHQHMSHVINTCQQHMSSTHVINTCHQHISSTHGINTCHQHMSSTPSPSPVTCIRVSSVSSSVSIVVFSKTQGPSVRSWESLQENRWM
jgi:hypothetical protein